MKVGDEFVAREHPKKRTTTRFRVERPYPEGGCFAVNAINQASNVKGGFIPNIIYTATSMKACEEMGLIEWLVKDGVAVERAVTREAEADIVEFVPRPFDDDEAEIVEFERPIAA